MYIIPFYVLSQTEFFHQTFSTNSVASSINLLTTKDLCIIFKSICLHFIIHLLILAVSFPFTLYSSQEETSSP